MRRSRPFTYSGERGASRAASPPSRPPSSPPLGPRQLQQVDLSACRPGRQQRDLQLKALARTASARYGGRRPGRPSGGRACGRPPPEHAGPHNICARATAAQTIAAPASDYRASVSACTALTRRCGWRYRYNSCSGRWCGAPPAPSHHLPGPRPLFGQPGRTFHAHSSEPDALGRRGACSLL